jgi:hypothetical protein
MAWEKKVSMKAGLVPFLVYTAGLVDLEASDRKFHDAALLFKVQNEADEDVVLSSINALYDQYKGASLNVAAICSGVISLMGKTNSVFANPQLFGTLSKRVTDVLDANTEPKERAEGDTKVYTFAVRRGPGGGHMRISDQTK